jgi:hypothetical protein
MIENSIFVQGCLDHAEALDVENSQIAEALAEGKTWTDHSLSPLTTYEGRITRRADKNMVHRIGRRFRACRRPTGSSFFQPPKSPASGTAAPVSIWPGKSPTIPSTSKKAA